jgi:hypothetical protein
VAVDRETPIQRAIVAYLRAVMPDALVHHAPGESHLSGKKAMMATVRKKANGMVTGWPDLIVLPYATVGAIFFEVKAEGNYATPSQKAVHAHLERLGYRVAVVRSIDDVRECLRAWGVGFSERAA